MKRMLIHKNNKNNTIAFRLNDELYKNILTDMNKLGFEKISQYITWVLKNQHKSSGIK